MKKWILPGMFFIFSISMMAQQADLKLNLEKNKIYRLKSVSDQTVVQTVNGVEQTTSSKSNTVFSIKMIDKTANVIIAEVRFDTLITHTNQMGKMMTISSSSEGNIASSETGEVITVFMNRLSKNALFVKLDPAGKVTEIVNLKMLSDIIMKDTGLITSEMASIIKTQIRSTINEQGLKSMIEMFTYNLPGKQVKAGDQWEVASSVSSGGMSMDINSIYKLDDLKDQIANVSTEASIKASVNAKPLEYSGAKITYDDLTGIVKSSMMLNASTGLTMENNSRTVIKANLNVSVQGMNMQIPMEINSESTIISL